MMNNVIDVEYSSGTIYRAIAEAKKMASQIDNLFVSSLFSNVNVTIKFKFNNKTIRVNQHSKVDSLVEEYNRPPTDIVEIKFPPDVGP